MSEAAQGPDFPDGLGYFAFERKAYGQNEQSIIHVTGYRNWLNNGHPVPAIQIDYSPLWKPKDADGWQGKYTRLHMPWEIPLAAPASVPAEIAEYLQWLCEYELNEMSQEANIMGQCAIEPDRIELAKRAITWLAQQG